MSEIKAKEVMVGVRQSQMIIEGVAYCDFCWTPRSTETADDDSLCACIKEPVITCEDCCNINKPCLFCHPDHFANHKVAMAILDELLKPYDEKENHSLTCHCEGCEEELDCIQREHDYEYQQDYDYDRYY